MESRAPQAILSIILKLYLLIKCNSSTFVQITVFLFIFDLPTLANHKEIIRKLGLSEIHGAQKGPGRLHETSDKYTYFQKVVLLFQIIIVIPENYNQQNCSLHLKKLQSAKPFSTSQKITTSNNHSRKKPQEREKRSQKKRKEGRRGIA